MTIYIDPEFKCHVSDDGTMTAIDTEFFDGKCQEFIEGYRFVPEGMTWLRADWTLFEGEMICPWKPYAGLAYAQALHEIRVREEALAVLGVVADD